MGVSLRFSLFLEFVKYGELSCNTAVYSPIVATMKTEDYLGDEAILSELGRVLAEHRIGMGLTQAELAKQAGIGKRTVERIEGGNSCQTLALIRVLRVLKLQDALNQLILPAGPTPMDLLKLKKKERKRASSQRKRIGKSVAAKATSRVSGKRADKKWTWGDEA